MSPCPSRSIATAKTRSIIWRRLTEGGKEGPCGWLKDRYGLSWQVVPVVLLEMMLERDASKSARVMAAFMQMKKFDIEALKRAYEGETV